MEEKRFYEEDFRDFLYQLIEDKRLNEDKEYGIAKLVVDKGFEILSDKQKFTLTNAIKDYTHDECKRCGNDIPWSEMYATEENGGYCDWCSHMMQKDKD